MYKNSSWDLVDAMKDKGFNYSKLDKNSLPKHLQNKSDKELKEHIELKRNERVLIQKKIQDLNKSRKEYIKQHQKKSTAKNDLESALITAIKKQAKKKNFSWD